MRYLYFFVKIMLYKTTDGYLNIISTRLSTSCPQVTRHTQYEFNTHSLELTRKSCSKYHIHECQLSPSRLTTAAPSHLRRAPLLQSTETSLSLSYWVTNLCLCQTSRESLGTGLVFKAWINLNSSQINQRPQPSLTFSAAAHDHGRREINVRCTSINQPSYQQKIQNLIPKKRFLYFLFYTLNLFYSITKREYNFTSLR